MTKDVLIQRLSNLSGCSKRDVNNVLAAFVEITKKTVLEERERFATPNLATFYQKENKDGLRKNSLTGKMVNVPSRVILGVKISKDMVIEA